MQVYIHDETSSNGINGSVAMTSHVSCTHLVEVVTDDLPDARPLQTNATHVVVRDLNDLLQREHARSHQVGQLVQ